MKLDTEKQRELLLQCLAAIQVPGGDMLDAIYELKQAIKKAEVANE